MPKPSRMSASRRGRAASVTWRGRRNNQRGQRILSDERPDSAVDQPVSDDDEQPGESSDDDGRWPYLSDTIQLHAGLQMFKLPLRSRWQCG